MSRFSRSGVTATVHAVGGLHLYCRGPLDPRLDVMAYVVMGYMVMAYMAMAYTVMACDVAFLHLYGRGPLGPSLGRPRRGVSPWPI